MLTINTQQPHKVKFNAYKLAQRRPYNKFSEEEIGYSALAAAIVRQAVEDYRYADEYLRGLHAQKSESWANRYAHNAEHTKDEVIKFFRSQWYGTLCDIDPEKIIRKLRTGK